MLRRKFSYIAAIIATLACLLSCSKDTENILGEGTTVTLSFYTGEMQTRATTPGDGVVADGGGIYRDGSGNPDLIILIAEAGTPGTIVKRYRGIGTSQDGNLVSSTATEAKVAFSFAGDPAGQYVVYALGNAQGLWPMIKEGDNDTDDSKVITVDDLMNEVKVPTWEVLESLRFRKLAPNAAPELINDRMPLSAEGELEVSSGKNGQVRLELLRCIAKVTAEFINNTGGTLDLDHYSHYIKNICPDNGYIIKHPAVSPASAVMGTLNATVNDHEIVSESSLSHSWYVFPSVGPYTCDIHFTVDEKDYTYNNLPVTNNRREDIPSLTRNQHLHIVTRISKGLKVSFNFEVANWEDVSAQVQFD